MFSQFFVLSLRGDTILHKDCKYKTFQLVPMAPSALPSAPECKLKLLAAQSKAVI